MGVTFLGKFLFFLLKSSIFAKICGVNVSNNPKTKIREGTYRVEDFRLV